MSFSRVPLPQCLSLEGPWLNQELTNRLDWLAKGASCLCVSSNPSTGVTSIQSHLAIKKKKT